MRTFHPSFSLDTVVHSRAVPVTSGIGASKMTFPEPGEEMRASVQTLTAKGEDAAGRVWTDADHTVRTDGDIAADVGDRFEWRGRILNATGWTEPAGQGDVRWITPCREVR